MNNITLTCKGAIKCMGFIRKTSLIALLLLLSWCCVLPAHGWCMTISGTNQSITIPITQWQTLKNELDGLNQELILCQQDLTKLKKPQQTLVEELNQAQTLQKRLVQELTESKNELTLLSKEAEELKISLQTLKESIDKERRVHRRQIWQSRLWCILIGAGIGIAIK